MSSIMLEHLIALQQRLDQENIGFVLGGGMSLYIRQTYLNRKPLQRYPFFIATRSTQDIDVFLNSQVIVDHKKVDKLKAILADLNYKPSKDALYFQFVKKVQLAGSEHTIRIDLLASPPKEEDQGLVKISHPRIRPKQSTQIHAFLTDEAAGIEFGKLPVALEDSNNNPVTVYIPSAYNYLILKLHAFDDRKEREDQKSDFGRHHAFDIFATICQMDEVDWANAKVHYEQDKNRRYLKRACKIRESCFFKATDLGMIRVKENQNYRSQKDLFDLYQESFLKDLKDLFPADD